MEICVTSCNFKTEEGKETFKVSRDQKKQDRTKNVVPFLIDLLVGWMYDRHTWPFSDRQLKTHHKQEDYGSSHNYLTHRLLSSRRNIDHRQECVGISQANNIIRIDLVEGYSIIRVNIYRPYGHHQTHPRLCILIK